MHVARYTRRQAVEQLALQTTTPPPQPTNSEWRRRRLRIYSMPPEATIPRLQYVEATENEEDTIENDNKEQTLAFLTSLLNSPDVKNVDSDEACVICLDLLSLGRSIFLECAHGFHVQCLIEWSKIKLTCPTCRTPYLFLN